MSQERTTVCVIGANGFIGVNSVLALHQLGFHVRAAVRKADCTPSAWESMGVQVVEADIMNPQSLTACVQGCDVVVNCAGIYRWWLPNHDDFVRVNDEGAGHVADACLSQGVRRLVHFSTPMSFGYPSVKPFTEASEAGPHASEYARTKRMGDLRVQALCKGTALDVVTLHLGCTIGEGDTMSAGRIAAVIRDHIEGKIPMLVGGDTNFIYVYIGDVRKALVAAVEAPASKVAGEVFFIANSGDMMTTRGFFNLVGKHTGMPAPSRDLPLSVGLWFSKVTTWWATNVSGSEPTAPVDIMRTAQFGSIEYSSQKSIDVLGMSYTPIDDAIAESVADVRRRMTANARL